MNRLKREFFKQSAFKTAENILGKYLIRKIGSKKLEGRIVEVEAYLGERDKAAHVYKGKRTKRNEVVYSGNGLCYIYLVYGIHWQLNITVGGKQSQCLLIRGLEIEENKNLTNGPGKLCRWLKLDKSFYGEDFVKSRRIWLENRGGEKEEIIKTKRVGIDYAEEWKNKKLRFYLKGNKFVSKR